MKVLMFSTDKSILESGSPTQARMIEYGSLVEKLFIIVLSKKKTVNQILDISQNTKVCSTCFWSAWNLRTKFVNQEINLITSQDPFETGLISYLVARHLKVKLQLQIHTDFLSSYFINESIKNRIRVYLAKWLLSKAQSIRVVSERIKKSLMAYNLRLTAITVLPIFVDVKKIQSTPITLDLHKKYSQFDFIIFMASRLTREKNISLAIKAMSEIVKINSKIGLIIVGDGPEQNNLRCEIQNLKLETNIFFESWSDNLSSYYKTTDIFLNTSNYEGYGRTLIEAAAASCLIISTDVGVVGETINNENSLIIPVNNIEALRQAILRLCDDKNLQQKLRQSAQDAVQKFDDKEVYLEKYKQSLQV